MTALAGVELESLVSEPDALTTRPLRIWSLSLVEVLLYLKYSPNFYLPEKALALSFLCYQWPYRHGKEKSICRLHPAQLLISSQNFWM